MRKITLIIIALVFAAILIGLIYFIFFFKFDNVQEPAIVPDTAKIDNSVPQQSTEPDQEENNYTPVELKPKKIGAEDLKSIASSFAERFGSYSNHSNYNNIIDLKLFMSKSMQSWADDYVEELRKNNQGTGIYFGVTTKAISQSVEKFDDNLGTSEIIIKTQRRESSGLVGNAVVKYQDISVSFVKENGAWKVDKAEWK